MMMMLRPTLVAVVVVVLQSNIIKPPASSFSISHMAGFVSNTLVVMTSKMTMK
jgi:hypothetical protein